MTSREKIRHVKTIYRMFSRDVTGFEFFPRKLVSAILVSLRGSSLMWSPVIYDPFTSEKICKEKDNAPQLSEYANTLDPLVKKRYMQKIAYIGVDPFLASYQNYDAECLPPTESIDLVSYLVLKPATIVRNNLKSLKVFQHITSWSLDLYKVSTDLSLPANIIINFKSNSLQLRKITMTFCCL